MTSKQFFNRISKIKDIIYSCPYFVLNYYFESEFTFVVVAPINSIIPTNIISSIPKGDNVHSIVRISLPHDGQQVIELVISLDV